MTPTSFLYRHGLTLLVLTPLAVLVMGADAAGGRSVCPGPPPAPADDAVVFIGEALEGPAEPSTAELLSPAEFRVERWVSTDQSRTEIRVETAVSIEDGLVRSLSTGIAPRAGERWSIVGELGDDGVVETSTCLGSERLRRVAEPGDAAAAPSRPGGGRPPDPGEDRVLSLAVAAAGGTALAISLARRLDRSSS